MGALREQIEKDLAGNHPRGVLSHMTVEQIDALSYGGANKEIMRRVDETFEAEYISRGDVIKKMNITAHHLGHVRILHDVEIFWEGKRLYFRRSEIELAVKAYKEAKDAK